MDRRPATASLSIPSSHTQGNAAFRQAKYDEAVALYTEAMRKDPSESTYPLNRCMAHLKLQKCVSLRARSRHLVT